jgi:serine O-acetyltransferase
MSAEPISANPPVGETPAATARPTVEIRPAAVAPPPRPAVDLSGATDRNPSSLSFPALVAEDFRTHGSRLTSPGFWAVAVHRFGNWRMGIRSPMRAPLTVAYRAAYHAVRLVCGIEIPYNNPIGRRLRIEHHGNLIVGTRSIGDDVVLRHGACLGVFRQGAPDDAKPTLGDRVELGPRACVIGPVTIGHDSLIGAGSVVASNVRPHSIIFGVPGRPVDLARETAPAPARSSGDAR